MVFSNEVVFRLDDFKIFDYPEPIILVGTDLLGHASKGPYTFAYLGVNPITAVGEILFFCKNTRKLIVCELVHAPTSHTNSHVLSAPSKKQVSFDEKAKPRAGDLVALAKSQG